MDPTLVAIVQDLKKVDLAHRTGLANLSYILKNTLFTKFELDYKSNARNLDAISIITSALSQGISSTRGFSPTKNGLCAEMTILRSLVALQIPMDFPVEQADGSTAPLHTLVEICAQRILAYISTFTNIVQIAPIPVPELIRLLHTFANFDNEVTPQFKVTINQLKHALFECAMDTNHRSLLWDVSLQIELLWCNANLGLSQDGSFNPAIRPFQVEFMLHLVNYRAEKGYALNAKEAKQLYQIRAAFLKTKLDFPASLLDKMKTFIPEFQQNATGSGFEDRIRHMFTRRNGIFSKFKQYKFFSEKNFNFDNPIVLELGLEADILFTCPRTKKQIPFQVDGERWHEFPNWHGDQKLDQKTLFRDFCFKNADMPIHRITDSTSSISALQNLIYTEVMPKVDEAESRIGYAWMMANSVNNNSILANCMYAPLNDFIDQISKHNPDKLPFFQQVKTLDALTKEALQYQMKESADSSTVDLTSQLKLLSVIDGSIASTPSGSPGSRSGSCSHASSGSSTPSDWQVVSKSKQRKPQSGMPSPFGSPQFTSPRGGDFPSFARAYTPSYGSSSPASRSSSRVSSASDVLSPRASPMLSKKASSGTEEKL